MRTAKTLIDWADAQSDLSLRWAQMPFCWFYHEVAQKNWTAGKLAVVILKLGQVMRKYVLRHMRTTKVQISLHIRAV